MDCNYGYSISKSANKKKTLKEKPEELLPKGKIEVEDLDSSRSEYEEEMDESNHEESSQESEEKSGEDYGSENEEELQESRKA